MRCERAQIELTREDGRRHRSTPPLIVVILFSSSLSFRVVSIVTNIPGRGNDDNHDDARVLLDLSARTIGGHRATDWIRSA